MSDTFKTGDICVSIEPRKDNPYGHIIVLHEFDDDLQRWRYAVASNPGKTVDMRLPKDLKCYYAMSKSKKPDYFYSNDPMHIEAAYLQRDRLRAAREIKKDRDEQLRKEFFVKHTALLVEYGVEIYATQTSGDDQGVEMEIEYAFLHD